MCPACLGISTWLIAGGISTGSALVCYAGKVLKENMEKTSQPAATTDKANNISPNLNSLRKPV